MAVSRFDKPRQSMAVKPMSFEEMAYAPALMRQQEDVLQQQVDVAADQLSNINIPDPDVQNVVGSWDKQLGDLSQEIATKGYSPDTANKFRDLNRKYQQDIKPIQQYIVARQEASNEYNKLARDPSKYLEGTSPTQVGYAQYLENPGQLQNYKVYDTNKVRTDAQGAAKRLANMAVGDPGFIKKNVPGLAGYIQVAEKRGFNTPEAVMQWLTTDEGQNYMATNLQSYGYATSPAMSNLFAREFVNYAFKAPKWQLVADKDYMTPLQRAKLAGLKGSSDMLQPSGRKALNLADSREGLPIGQKIMQQAFERLKDKYPEFANVPDVKTLRGIAGAGELQEQTGQFKSLGRGNLPMMGTEQSAQAVKMLSELEGISDNIIKDLDIQEFSLDRLSNIDSKTKTVVDNASKAINETLANNLQYLSAMNADDNKELKNLKEAIANGDISGNDVKITLKTVTTPTDLGGGLSQSSIYRVNIDYGIGSKKKSINDVDIFADDKAVELRNQSNKFFDSLSKTPTFEIENKAVQYGPMLENYIKKSPDLTINDIMKSVSGGKPTNELTQDDIQEMRAVGKALAKFMGISVTELKDFENIRLGTYYGK